MDILLNHIGYDRVGPKKGVLKCGQGSRYRGEPLGFTIVESESSQPVFRGRCRPAGAVERWKDWLFQILDFSQLEREGRYYLQIAPEAAPTGGGALPALRSAQFEIRERLLLERTVPAVLRYFASQRCSGLLDQADRRARFFGGRRERVDVHGGWYDASGDKSKYLSHLSYANFMNPQQAPMAVWIFLAARDLLEGDRPAGEGRANLRRRLLEEALYGADFLLRMQDPAGYFYTTVFDRWSKDPEQREICSFRSQAGIKSADYQAGYRQGGGVAIAALARAALARAAGERVAGARAAGAGGGAAAAQRAQAWAAYLRAAIKGFLHLERHNREYLDDGRENIIDDYCALLAASELFLASGQARFLQAARRRASGLIGRLAADERYQGWWRAAEEGERPYFHAAEAGLPVIALLRYSQVEPDGAAVRGALAAVEQSLRFELLITEEVANPFGYARQYVRPLGGEKRSAFFIPHRNESGYWWQGEDARLASLAAAARLAGRSHLAGSELGRRLEGYAADQLNWILGLNPYDTCMLHGFGRNNPEYEAAWPNAFGGICNGITAGFADEQDCDFLPQPYADQGEHRWRWSEQWIPHAAWYLLALCAGV